MNSTRSTRIGVIAEDDSDVESIRILIQRISERDNIGIKRFTGNGCGKIKRKIHSWATSLKTMKCKLLIVIHDLDRNDHKVLRTELETAISPSPIETYLICIPIEEMEAWWLADPIAIKRALNLQTTPKVSKNPERIESPKEHIGRLVSQASNRTKMYLNTKHNSKIAEEINLNRVMRCDSFLPFYDFIERHLK